MVKYYSYFIILCSISLMNCEHKQEIEIEIPEYKNGYVVEAYLSPDKEFGLLITRSYGFTEVYDSTKLNLDYLSSLIVEGAVGYIEVNGIRHKLINQLKLVPGTTTVYNYLIQDSVRFKVHDRVYLTLSLPEGQIIHAETQIPEHRPIDSMRLVIDDNKEARETTFFSSDSTKTEYFRRQLLRIRNNKSKVIQDYVIDNETALNGRLAFGSGYEFDVGDTLVSRVTHVTKSYYDFFLGVTGSINANANPFGTPGKISSNIKGSKLVTGIFTGINESEILKKVE